LPRRNFTLLKAESLTNDGTALVVYAIAVGVAMGGEYTPLSITGLVMLSYVGGIAAGAAVAGVAYVVMRRLADAITINIALLLVPFSAFLLAELIHASGVLAVVVAGLIIAFVASRISTAASRRQTESAWPLGSYILNGALFVLIGLQVQAVVQDVAAVNIGLVIGTVLAVWMTLLVVHFGFQVASAYLIRLLDRRPSQLARCMSNRARVVGAFAGFRGAVSLAIALSVPEALPDGQPLPGRNEIVIVTAGVIVMTLLVQGPLLPAVMRWSRMTGDRGGGGEEEMYIAERAITTAALTALTHLAAEHRVGDEVRDRLRRDYEEFLDVADARRRSEQGIDGATQHAAFAGEEPSATVAEQASTVSTGTASPLSRDEEYRRLRLAVLDRKREVLTRLRREETIDPSIAREVQTRLDIEELRLSGVDPID
jgi:Na+/H+ antiporter